jgi:hypothetical protein
MRPSYSPLTIVTWIAAAVVGVLLFGLAIVNCAHTVRLNDTIDINEGEPFPLTGHRFVRVHLDLGGVPGDRCDAMTGSYEPQSRTCLVLIFP